MRVLTQFLHVSKELFHIPLMKRKVDLHFVHKFSILSSQILIPASQQAEKSLPEEKKIVVPIIRPNSVICFHPHNNFHKSSQQFDSQQLIPKEMSETQYEALADETLNSLHDFFDALPEFASCTDDYDSEFGNGVLTVHFNGTVGTYVINKQTPNKQIWLSSPKTGPKRYDFCGNKWIYRHDGIGLHQFLEEEISEIVLSKVSLKDCMHYS